MSALLAAIERVTDTVTIESVTDSVMIDSIMIESVTDSAVFCLKTGGRSIHSGGSPSIQGQTDPGEFMCPRTDEPGVHPSRGSNNPLTPVSIKHWSRLNTGLD